jgi:hypothetical protein
MRLPPRMSSEAKKALIKKIIRDLTGVEINHWGDRSNIKLITGFTHYEQDLMWYMASWLFQPRATECRKNLQKLVYIYNRPCYQDQIIANILRFE